MVFQKSDKRICKASGEVSLLFGFEPPGKVLGNDADDIRVMLEAKFGAIDAQTGKMRWTFNTIKAPWAHPFLSGGGGARSLTGAGGRVMHDASSSAAATGASTRHECAKLK